MSDDIIQLKLLTIGDSGKINEYINLYLMEYDILKYNKQYGYI